MLLVTSDGLSSSVSSSFTGQERGEKTGLLKTPAPQEPASSSYQPASRNIQHCPSCLPIVITANPPGLQSQPKHYLTTSPFYSENPYEEKKAWLSQISYACPVLHLLLTQPAQLWCDTSFSTQPTHTSATSQLLVCEKTI